MLDISTFNYREEERTPSLYKAWEPVPPVCVPRPLSSPTEISKPYPCALLISHHCGPRGPRGFCLPPSYPHHHPLRLSSTETRLTEGFYPPAPFFDSSTLFLGHGSRCQSPQRKVGVWRVRMESAWCSSIFYLIVRLLQWVEAILFFSIVLNWEEQAVEISSRELHHPPAPS